MSLECGHAQDVPQPRLPVGVIEISYVIGGPDHKVDGPPKYRGIDGARTALADGDTTAAPEPLEPLIAPARPHSTPRGEPVELRDLTE